MRLFLGVGLVLALTACGAAAGVVTHAPLVEPAALDVDATDCGERVSGTLRVSRGTLLFVPDGADRDDRDDRDETDEATAGPPWAEAPVVIALHPRGDASQVPSLSPLVSGMFDAAYAVAGGDGLPSALVQVGVDPSRQLEPLYAPDGGLWLLGRYGEHLAVLVRDGEGHAIALLESVAEDRPDGTHRIYREHARSERLSLPFAGFLEGALGVGLPHVAPVGDHALLMACDETAWCLASFEGGAITITRLDGPSVSDDTRRFGPLTLDDDGVACVVDDGEEHPPFAPALAPVADPGDPDAEALPTDGRLEDGVALDTERCWVRSGITLPSLADTGENAYTTASLLEVPHEEAANDSHLELYVRGERIEVGLVLRDDGGRGMAGGRDFALALPPGAIEVTPVRVGGVPLFHVRATPAMPAVRWPDCVMGRLVVRVTSGPYGAQLHHERYWEDGRCE